MDPIANTIIPPTTCQAPQLLGGLERADAVEALELIMIPPRLDPIMDVVDVDLVVGPDHVVEAKDQG